ECRELRLRSKRSFIGSAGARSRSRRRGADRANVVRTSRFCESGDELRQFRSGIVDNACSYGTSSHGAMRWAFLSTERERLQSEWNLIIHVAARTSAGECGRLFTRSGRTK